MNTPLKKILYAEDEPDIQQLVAMVLEMVGNFNLKVCNSGKEALAHIDEFNPDLILSDVMMPEVDGVTLLRTIRSDAKYKNLPLIFMTAKAEEYDIENYIKQGALKVIPKPFEPIKLSDQIKEVWENFVYEN